MPLRSITGLRPQIPLEETIGVDVVFTSDVSKWSRCIVVESGEFTTVRDEDKLDLRQLPAVDATGAVEPEQKKVFLISQVMQLMLKQVAA